MKNIFAHSSKATVVFPACFVELPASVAEGKRAAFYLAAEEYLAKEYPEDNYMFTWQVGPTVVMGRHQVAQAEVDLDFCRSNGIDIIRRKSGGGCIFADSGNIMVSVVTGPGAVEGLFVEYAQNVATALCRLGVPASVSGRNDIVVEGVGKICGNAFYHLQNRNIVHGTMLYDSNLDLMAGALTPDRAKLCSKGVKSVKSRVAFLKDSLSMDVSSLRTYLRQELTDRSIRLTEDDIQYIKAIEADYYDPIFLYGKNFRADATVQGRVENCGKIILHFSMCGPQIERVEVGGDYFATGDTETAFQEAFDGRNFTVPSLLAAIDEYHPERTIHGLSKEGLEQLILEQCG